MWLLIQVHSSFEIIAINLNRHKSGNNPNHAMFLFEFSSLVLLRTPEEELGSVGESTGS